MEATYFRNGALQDLAEYLQGVKPEYPASNFKLLDIRTPINVSGDPRSILQTLKIMELRARAEQALGDEFDIKEFHHMVLQTGCIPLAILEEQIDQWIKSRASTKIET